MIKLALRDAFLDSDILTHATMSNGFAGFKLWITKNFYMTGQERTVVLTKLEQDGIVEFIAPSKTGTRKYEVTALIEED